MYNSSTEKLILRTLFSQVFILLVESNNKKTPWPESASELYLPSDRRLLAKLVPTF
jgi:hypothetical protein